MIEEYPLTLSDDRTVLVKCDTDFEGDVIIPDSVISIGEGAFWNCNKLTSIKIPDSVTSIGKEAFSRCYKLASIEIPDSVTSIKNGAFEDCYMLTGFHSGIKDVSVFGDDEILDSEVKETCTIYVPKGCVEDYRNHPAFREFMNIVEEEEWAD